MPRQNGRAAERHSRGTSAAERHSGIAAERHESGRAASRQSGRPTGKHFEMLPNMTTEFVGNKFYITLQKKIHAVKKDL